MKDCDVCKKLIKEKHRNMIWWKICCIIFAALTIVLGVLYFSSGAIITEKELAIEHSFNEIDGNNVIIDSEQINDSYNGTITELDYMPIFIIVAVIDVAILIIGGVFIANYFKKDL